MPVPVLKLIQITRCTHTILVDLKAILCNPFALEFKTPFLLNDEEQTASLGAKAYSLLSAKLTLPYFSAAGEI